MRQRDTRPPVHPTVHLSSNKPPVGGHCPIATLRVSGGAVLTNTPVSQDLTRHVRNQE